MWPHGTSVIVADHAVARTALFHQQELDPHGSHAGAPGRATPNTGLFPMDRHPVGQAGPGRIAARADLLILFAGEAAAFLDNVSTVVRLTPLILYIIYIVRTLRISARPYLLARILAANIGGTATLIGDLHDHIIAGKRIIARSV
jgi:hypothetical protein